MKKIIFNFINFNILVLVFWYSADLQVYDEALSAGTVENYFLNRESAKQLDTVFTIGNLKKSTHTNNIATRHEEVIKPRNIIKSNFKEAFGATFGISKHNDFNTIKVYTPSKISIFKTPVWSLTYLFFLFISVGYILAKTNVLNRMYAYSKQHISRTKRNKDSHLIVKENGAMVKIKSSDIVYVKSAGNYIDVFTKSKAHTIRMNIGTFLENVPNKYEFMRVHRSYIVRIENITAKAARFVLLNDSVKIPVSNSYRKDMKSIQL